MLTRVLYPMNEIHLIRPLWLLALIPWILLVWRMAKTTFLQSGWHRVCDAHLLPHILNQPKQISKKYPAFLVLIAGILTIIALSGPVYHQLPQPVFRNQSALVLILDLSLSMDATDAKPSRLIQSKHKIVDILRKRREGQTALIVFANQPFVVSPLTNDTATISLQLATLETGLMPAQGSRPDLAMEKAVDLLHQGGINRGKILLVTDGWSEESELSAQAIHTQGHTLSILGVGTSEGSPIPTSKGGFLKDSQGNIVIAKLDPKHLQQLAQMGGGRYQHIRTDDFDIETLNILNDAVSLENTMEKSELMADIWREEGPWFLLMVLPLAALVFRRGLLVFLLPFMILLNPITMRQAQALDWHNLWKSPDQRAMQQLNNNQVKEAATLFKDPEWKATAHYKNGSFEQAVESLNGIDSPDAHYNRGTSLARLGKLQEAKSAFDTVLKQQPNHEDAQYNLDQVIKAIKEQEKQSQQQGSDQKDPSKQGEDKEKSSDSQGNNETGQEGTQAENEEKQKGSEEASSEQSKEGDDKADMNHQKNSKKEASEKMSSKNTETSQTEADKKMAQMQEEEQSKESQLAIDQWLRRIPEDPGGLLRRKFRYQYQQKYRQSNQEVNPW